MTSISLNLNSLDIENFVLSYSIIIIPNVSTLKDYINYEPHVDLSKVKVLLTITENVNDILLSRMFKLTSKNPFIYLRSAIGDKTLTINYYYEDIILTMSVNFSIINNIYPAYKDGDQVILYEPCFPEEDLSIYSPYTIDIYQTTNHTTYYKVYFRFLDNDNIPILNSERIYIYKLVDNIPLISYNTNDLEIENYYWRIVDFERFFTQSDLLFLNNVLKDYSGIHSDKISRMALIIKKYFKDNLKNMKITFSLK